MAQSTFTKAVTFLRNRLTEDQLNALGEQLMREVEKLSQRHKKKFPDYTLGINVVARVDNILGEQLAQLRLARGLHQPKAAQLLSWSKSKLIRVEGGEVSINKADLLHLLDVYEVRDASTREELLTRAEAVYRRKRGGGAWR